jgi:KDO2-lipid IV(A) lauroyltransferase
VPLAALVAGADRAARLVGPRLLRPQAEALAANLDRVFEAETTPLISGLSPHYGQPDRAVAPGFGSYGRYWAESFRLPHLDPVTIDRGFSFLGNQHIERVRASGVGPIIVLPHLGGWEWAAAWLAVVRGVGVTAVVERLEPPEVFDWFQELRARYGVNVVPAGPGAMTALVEAVKRRDVVCLPADRDIGGTGIPVEFFGQPVSMPVGPAVLARRTGAPILPTGVFFRDRQRVTVVTEPIEVQGRGRSENERLTRLSADRMAQLVASAPDQWHVLEELWSSEVD